MSEYNVGDKVRIVQNSGFAGNNSQKHIGKVGVVLRRARVTGRDMIYRVSLPEELGGGVTCHSRELQPAGALDAAAQKLREANKALQDAKAAVTLAEEQFESAREALAAACLAEVQP